MLKQNICICVFITANLEERGLGVQQENQRRRVQPALGSRGADQAEEARAPPRSGHQRTLRTKAGTGQRPLCRAQRLETAVGGREEDSGKEGETTEHQGVQGNLIGIIIYVTDGGKEIISLPL